MPPLSTQTFQRFIVIWLLVFCFANVKAQMCTGALGDPILNVTFGSGTAQYAKSLGDTTSYTYIQTPCPDDSYYTITHSVGDCFVHTWHPLEHDHTGDPNGYMLLVNASPGPGVFFTYPVHGLCTGATYEFGIWLLNLNTPDDCGGFPKLPNVAFTVETTDGKILASVYTGFIKYSDGPVWKQYVADFKTPPGVTDVVIKINNANTASGTCGNDMAIDDITVRPCGPIVHSTFVATNTDDPLNLCAGYTGPVGVQASVDTTAYAKVAFQWQYNAGDSWINLVGANKITYNIPYNNIQVGTYEYRLLVGEEANIDMPHCRVISNTLTVIVHPAAVATATALNPNLCYADTVKLYATGGVTYQWTGPSNFTSALQNPVLPTANESKAGTYTVNVTTMNGCSASASVNIVVYPHIDLLISKNTTICEGTSTMLAATGAAQYQWSPALGLSNAKIANPVASPVNTTKYKVTATSATGCVKVDSVTIYVSKKATAYAGRDTVLLYGQSVQLNGAVSGPKVTYSWSPATYLNNVNILNPIAKPPVDTYYTLFAADSCNVTTSTVLIKVFKTVQVPNTFSPNGDGVNDTWRIADLAAFPDCLVNIYDRYGRRLFLSTGYVKAWDGVYEGKPVPVGTYYYVINLNAKTPPLSGYIAVLR